MLLELEQALRLSHLGLLLLLLLLESCTLRSERLESRRDETRVALLLLAGHLLLHKLRLQQLELELLGGKELLLLLEDVGVLAKLGEVDTLARLDIGKREVRKAAAGEAAGSEVLVEAVRDRLAATVGVAAPRSCLRGRLRCWRSR